jgi:dolichyl-phosphate beta-glucosyltransferase
MSAFLVVPCFNEARRLRPTELHRLVAHRPDLSLVFVDDGSTDETVAVLEGLRATAGARIVLHRLAANVGKAEAVRQGLRLALERGAALVGYADADLSTPVDELLRMLERMDADGPAALLGARVRLLGSAIERRPHRHYLGRAFATIASIALGIPVYDTQCGAKLFRRSDALVAALDAPFQSRWIFDVELLERLLRGVGGAAPLRVEDIEELPLRAWRDVAGSTLRPHAMMRAGVELLALLVRARVARRAPAPAPASPGEADAGSAPRRTGVAGGP